MLTIMLSSHKRRSFQCSCNNQVNIYIYISHSKRNAHIKHATQKQRLVEPKFGNKHPLTGLLPFPMLLLSAEGSPPSSLKPQKP